LKKVKKAQKSTKSKLGVFLMDSVKTEVKSAETMGEGV